MPALLSVFCLESGILHDLFLLGKSPVFRAFFQFLEVYGMAYIVERLIDFILYILNNALASELLFALNMSLLMIFSILSLVWIVRGCKS